jgi:hypothetical protein
MRKLESLIVKNPWHILSCGTQRKNCLKNRLAYFVKNRLAYFELLKSFVRTGFISKNNLYLPQIVPRA